ncbi:MAG: YbdK family carboxylate-amine ligase [Mariprofundaceae bacterium]|nr:YbdK family carboxylate-amine ligase [Mariprofundaceae bacterium]
MSPPLATLPFHTSELGSLGVEMEWVTVDAGSGAQVPAAPQLFSQIEPTPRIKPELFTSTIEINTEIHTGTANCIAELEALHKQVSALLAGQHAALLSCGTHPFSRWQDQTVSDDARYHRLVERLCWMARRFNIFGIHVHIGMPSGDDCIAALNHLLPVMPVFLAISANSPYWAKHDTGLSSCRIKIFEGLSQGGMPFYFENWKDFERCTQRLMMTESIDSVRDIWWEMRPHPDFGTLEIRIGDMPATRADTTAYVAYVRAEAMAAVHAETRARVHPSLIRENRWRACRYGINATIIAPETENLVPVLDWIENRLNILPEQGAEAEDIAIVRERLAHWRSRGDGADRQRRVRQEHPGWDDIIRLMRQDGWNDVPN